jgi:hypothetical protein
MLPLQFSYKCNKEVHNLMFKLRFHKNEITNFANQCKVTNKDIYIANHILPRVREDCFFEPTDFKTVCDWKSPRPRRLRELNPDNLIRSLTHTALTTKNERQRIEALVELEGVGVPTASALLHFGYDNEYPILDFRALWSLSVEIEPHKYTLEFWMEYTNYCRSLAESGGVSLAILDHALWMYSKLNQPHRIQYRSYSCKQKRNHKANFLVVPPRISVLPVPVY